MRRLFLSLAVMFGFAALGARATVPGDQNAAALVAVDPRIELMTVVQLLAGYQPLTTVNSRYRADALTHFEPVRDHRAVRLFREMNEEQFRFDAVPKVVLTFGPPPALPPIAPVDPSVLRRAGGSRRVEEFAAALRDFARVSRLESFLSGHQDLYARVVSALGPEVAAAIEPLRRYTGISLDNCVLLAAPLIHDGGFQATIGEAGRARVYALIGPFGERDGEPVFSESGSVAGLAQHEFSHSFVNPLVEKFSRDVNRSARLYDAIKADMQKQAYGDWPTAVHEHIVRAITLRLAYARSRADGDRALRNEEARGFRYVKALAARLEEYEAAREKYPTFETFFPRLLEVFRAHSRSGDAVRGSRGPDQSPLRLRMTSTAAARRAGVTTASRLTASSTAAVMMKIPGSRAVTPNRKLSMKRPNTAAPARPAARPAPPTSTPCRITRRNT
ncbi:MAG TPA: DUF4932 domain-containing protein [Vicinamibacterales bacterium]|nr:DUF4932 domain-containing protein [Vicinamibacterales bacterium]